MNEERYNLAVESIETATSVNRLGVVSKAIETRAAEGVFSEVEALVLQGMVLRRAYKLGGLMTGKESVYVNG